MRLTVLMIIAIVAVTAFVGYVYRQERQQAHLAEQRAAFESRMRCLEAERRLADYKAGNPVRYADTEAVTRQFVWDCRGRPGHLRPEDL